MCDLPYDDIVQRMDHIGLVDFYGSLRIESQRRSEALRDIFGGDNVNLAVFHQRFRLFRR